MDGKSGILRRNSGIKKGFGNSKMMFEVKQLIRPFRIVNKMIEFG